MKDFQYAPWLCIENHPIDGLRISNLPGGPKHCYFTSDATHLTDCGYMHLEAPIVLTDDEQVTLDRALDRMENFGITPPGDTE